MMSQLVDVYIDWQSQAMLMIMFYNVQKIDWSVTEMFVAVTADVVHIPAEDLSFNKAQISVRLVDFRNKTYKVGASGLLLPYYCRHHLLQPQKFNGRKRNFQGRAEMRTSSGV